MAFQVSPGVQVKEIDATSVVPAVSTSVGGFAGSFNWGPVEQVVTVGSEKELAAEFGSPDDNTALYFLTACFQMLMLLKANLVIQKFAKD